MAHPDDLPPETPRDPEEQAMARRSRMPPVTTGVIIGLLIILGGAVYVASALL
jgi:hypothetical protein